MLSWCIIPIEWSLCGHYVVRSEVKYELSGHLPGNRLRRITPDEVDAQIRNEMTEILGSSHPQPEAFLEFIEQIIQDTLLLARAEHASKSMFP